MSIIIEDPLMAEYVAHVRRYGDATLQNCLREVEGRAAWSDLSRDSAATVVPIIRRAIEASQPFSMVRVGDGTGNLLGYADPAFSRLRAFAVNEILRMTFGDSAFSEAEIDEIRAGLVGAICSADILGVSDLFRLNRLKIIDQEPSDSVDIRGYSGSRESYVAIARVLREHNVRPSYVVSNHMHRLLAGYMADILRDVEKVCVIGPYDLNDGIRAKFGIEDVKLRKIPNQASTSVDGRRWFPDEFRDLYRSIDPDRDGQVHLVAAGLLAKPLCAQIKARGGIALDIGSLIDVWAGRAVRHYHDDAFVSAHVVPSAGS